MYKVELYARLRRACMVDGMSTREAARVFGLHRDTVRKMLRYSAPPGYRRRSPPRRPKLDPILGNSALDRLANASYQIVIEGQSFRERLSPHRALLDRKEVVDPQTAQ